MFSDDVVNMILKGANANEIREFLLAHDDEGDKDGAICDKASLFAALSFIFEFPDESEKEDFRVSAYKAFFSKDKSCFETAWGCVESLGGSCGVDKKLRVLKGGYYKIKNYYLESSNLDDMRGASVLLSYVEETVIPDIIGKRFIPECVVCCGGGNIFALLPEYADEDFAIELEKSADTILIGASTAFCLSDPLPARLVFGESYAKNMSDIEQRLSERKKLKLYNTIKNRTELIGRTLDIKSDKDEGFSVEIEAETLDENKIFCMACGKRFSLYKYGGDKLCAGCLHKRIVGRAAVNGKFNSEYERLFGEAPKKVKRLEDISDDKTAVVYGDGNNFGGIIQAMTRITDMMEFSRKVRDAVSAAVFGALRKVGIKSFEVVALGGDDIFVIVPAKRALLFSTEMINIYNEKFGALYSIKSTLSVGICAAKLKTPVKIMLEAAEKQLDKAKEFEKSRTFEKRCGSVAFCILDSFSINDTKALKNGTYSSMQPYSLKTAQQLVSLSREFSGAARSRVRNLLDAFSNAESTEEAELFFKYLNAKGVFSERVCNMPELEGCEQRNGYYIADDKYYFIWGEILDIMSIAEDANKNEKEL